MTQRIDILDYHDAAHPRRIASFFFSEERGVTCDNEKLLARLENEGIATAPTVRLVYPRDGRIFFDSLKYRFTGIWRAQEPVRVMHGE